MNAETNRYSIGELARLTGLPVRTIRFYSDSGLVPEAGRTPAGYRTYDREALQRLGLVRTLRDPGIDLPTIRKVLDREVSVASMAAAHAAALDIQIRGLRLRRAVLRAVVERGATNHPSGHASGPASVREVELMNKLAQLSDAERRRMIEDFLDDVFRGLDIDPKFEHAMRSAMPDLPEEPTTAQIEAWVELAELVAQPDFRRRIRQMAERAAEDRAAGHAEYDEARSIWNALIDTKMTGQYWQNDNISDWKPGSRWEHRAHDGDRALRLVGKVIESKPPERTREKVRPSAAARCALATMMSAAAWATLGGSGRI